MNNLWTTVKDTVSAVWTKSWTKFLAWAQGLTATASALFMAAGTYITDPTVKAYLDMLSLPSWANISLATMAVLTYIAHGRSANS